MQGKVEYGRTTIRYEIVRNSPVGFLVLAVLGSGRRKVSQCHLEYHYDRSGDTSVR